MKVKFVSSLAVTAMVCLLGGVAVAQQTTEAKTIPDSSITQTYFSLPLSFEPNVGQTDEEARFLARGKGYSLFLTKEEAVLALRGEKKNAALRLRWLGANRSPVIVGERGLAGKVNYLRGNDPRKWKTDVPTFGTVRYREVYAGIDLVFYGKQRELEYDFVVAPGADPSRIRLGVEGAQKITIAKNGELVLRFQDGEVRQHKPVVYQEVNGERRLLAGNYVLRGKNEIGFEVAEYDRALPLVIDPVLGYATYLGGTGIEQIVDVAADAAGNAYVTGQTRSLDFPVKAAYDGTLAPSTPDSIDAFVSKIAADGKTLVFSTYLGGAGADIGVGIAVDGNNRPYVTGSTASNDFPISAGAFQAARPGGGDAFVTKLWATGGGITYSTYLGGTVEDEPWAIVVDGGGRATVVGSTRSADFPVRIAAQPAKRGGEDGFVTRLSWDGKTLVWSTFLGGSGDDAVQAVALDGNRANVAGRTTSSDFPTTSGAFQQTNRSSFQSGFVTRLWTNGGGLTYSTYLGGSGGTTPRAIAVDVDKRVYVASSTDSTDFPVTSGAYRTTMRGPQDIAVTRLNPTGTSLSYSTFVGGSSTESPAGIAVDGSNRAVVTGISNSTDFPLTNAMQVAQGENSSGILFMLNSTGSGLQSSTYLAAESPYAIALDPSGNIYIAGWHSSSNLPVTPGAFQSAWSGDTGSWNPDGFVAKIFPGNGSTSCAVPAADGSVNICFPEDGAAFKASEPINVEAAAFASAGVSVMEVYLDRIKAHTASGTNRLKATIILQGVGSHRLTVLAKDGTGTTFAQTIFINAE